MSTDKELILLPKLPDASMALDVYKSPEGLQPFVEHVRNAVASLVADTSTAKGRAEIKSMAFAVTRSKTALDNLGKTVVDELKAIPKLVDANRKAMRDALDALAEQVRKPLTDWEAQESERKRKEAEAKARVDAAIQKIKDAGAVQWGTPVATLQERIQRLESLPTTADAWGSAQCASQAEEARKASLASLRQMLADREEFERQQQELQLHQAQVQEQAQQQAPAAQESHAAPVAAAEPATEAVVRNQPVHEPAAQQPMAATTQAAPVRTAAPSNPAEHAAIALQQIVGITQAQAQAVVSAISRGEIPYLCVESM